MLKLLQAGYLCQSTHRVGTTMRCLFVWLGKSGVVLVMPEEPLQEAWAKLHATKDRTLSRTCLFVSELNYRKCSAFIHDPKPCAASRQAAHADKACSGAQYRDQACHCEQLSSPCNPM